MLYARYSLLSILSIIWQALTHDELGLNGVLPTAPGIAPDYWILTLLARPESNRTLHSRGWNPTRRLGTCGRIVVAEGT